MKRALIFLILLVSSSFFIIPFANASHNRAGEITYRHIGDCKSLCYEITILTYTRTSSILADRPVLDSVHFGDGTIGAFVRSSKVDLGNDISKNVYIKRHCYPSASSYWIHFEDPNRNDGVVNIPNSFYTPFAIQTLVVINPNVCPVNSSPILLNPPIDIGCVGKIFIHNPGAYDPDGKDSLSYELTLSRGSGNLPIPGYSFPKASNSPFVPTLDPITGDLVWDAPLDTGEYNIAFYITEWRKVGDDAVMVGVVERDMQIRIFNCKNNPPVINPLNDTCVLAGDSVNILVTTFDPDTNFVTLTSTSELYPPITTINPATFTPDLNNSKNDTVTGLFSWQPSCNQIRSKAYWVQFKAKDNWDTTLVDFEGFFINVIGPPVKNLTVTPTGNNMQLFWSSYLCASARKFNIYRRNGQYTGLLECPCQNGVPSFTGYTLIGFTNSISDTSFLDTNNGLGLSIGSSYCYLVTAVFADGSESCASPQVCALLKKVLPVLTNVSVIKTDANTGQIYIAWSPATDLDTNLFPPPYQYKLYHSPDFVGSNETLIQTFFDRNDTTFIDALLNTDTTAWSYRVELYSDSSGTPSLRGSAPRGSSIFLTLSPSDNKMILNWEEHVPWSNYRYDIFRHNPLTSLWDSIGTSTVQTFTDSILDNDSLYCYYIRSVGTYNAPDIIDPIINNSEEECARPIDNVPPCPPLLTILPDCNAETNLLTWTNPNHFCADDVLKYYIYFSPDSLQGYEVIDTVGNPNDTVFLHKNISSSAGCYKVVAIDSVGNQSDAIAVCIDTCREYMLPNVFTPNNDGHNDLFHPCDSTTDEALQAKCPPYKNVKDVEMKIFNRWGTLVFETADKDINWDGTNKFTKGDCPEGTYYYTCKVNFFKVQGTETKELNGYVHLVRDK